MAMFHRRDALALGLGSMAYSLSGWMGRLAAEGATRTDRKRACILLWMSGGPATIDLWDLKPGHAHGGPSKEIATADPGVRISEHLPKLAARMNDLAIVRSMTTKEGDHGRATYLLRTGNLPQGAIEFPVLGSLVAKELYDGADLPPFVSIAPQRALSPNAFGAGFLGPQLAPLVVADGAGLRADAKDLDTLLKVKNLDRAATVAAARADDRLALLQDLEGNFLETHRGAAADSHRAARDGALRLMKPATAKAFDLHEEAPALRDRYGRNVFGQGCLLARRLVERGVPFVEVTLDGWDTHAQNFDAVKNLAGVLDPAWSTLPADLADHGLLETTTIVWMGEFGRTPKINAQKGRDHFPDAFSAVLAGGGIRGGRVVGATSRDGTKVDEHPVSVPDLLATVCHALGIDPTRKNPSNVNRPISIVDAAAKPLLEVLRKA